MVIGTGTKVGRITYAQSFGYGSFRMKSGCELAVTDKPASTFSDKPAPQADTLGLSPPPITLPKGGGAIRAIGEKFGANPATCTGSLTVPIDASLGRSGFGPQLSVSYVIGKPSTWKIENDNPRVG